MTSLHSTTSVKSVHGLHGAQSAHLLWAHAHLAGHASVALEQKASQAAAPGMQSAKVA